MKISRRNFLKGAAIATGSYCIWHPVFPQGGSLDDFIQAQMEKNHIPGLGACIIKGGDIVWSRGYGWADIEKKIPYDPQNTVQNIGSVSKTFTATAVMQLWEQGKLKLDDDVNLHLPFKVRNPKYPEISITFRQLLTHRSSIKDGPAYGRSYACGDPSVSLETWIREYFTPGAKYSAEENFHEWKPGQEGQLPARPRAYSNVAFGLLGYLVERIAQLPFSEYCRANIFIPLDMKHTSWHLKELDLTRHALPYTYIPSGKSRQVLHEGGMTLKKSEEGGYYPNCLYSFYNYPDGLIRTSVFQLAHFLSAYINKGSYRGARILKQTTVEAMLSREHFDRGLCWFERSQTDGGSMWGHGGGDPGIAATMQFLTRSGIGVIVFANTSTGLDAIQNRLFQEAAQP